MAAATSDDALLLDGLLGRELDEQNVATAREIITGSGALAATEQEIAASTDEALAAIRGASIPEPARSGLINLAVLATQRES